MVRLIVADSNVWIFAESENAPEYSVAIERLQHHIESGLAINTVIFSEVFHHLSRIFGDVAKERVQRIINHPSIEWIEITAEDADNAMDLAVKHKLKINDALIAQQCLKEKMAIITDNVKDFSKVNGLKVIPVR